MVHIHVSLYSLFDLLTSQGLHNLFQFTNTSIVVVEQSLSMWIQSTIKHGGKCFQGLKRLFKIEFSAIDDNPRISF